MSRIGRLVCESVFIEWLSKEYANARRCPAEPRVGQRTSGVARSSAIAIASTFDPSNLHVTVVGHYWWLHEYMYRDWSHSSGPKSGCTNRNDLPKQSVVDMVRATLEKPDRPSKQNRQYAPLFQVVINFVEFVRQ